MGRASTFSLNKYLLRSQIYLNICIVGLSTLLMTIIAIQTFKQYSEQNLRLVSHALADQLQAPIVFDDKRSSEQILEQFVTQYQLTSIDVFDANNTLIFHKQSNEAVATNSSLQYLQGYLISPFAGHADIVYRKAKIGQVKIVENLQIVRHFLQLLMWTFLGCLSLTIALIYVNIHLLYSKITHALNVLAQTSLTLTRKRDFAQRVPMGQIDEVNVISDNFNQLLGELEQWYSHIEQENQNLTHRALHDPLTRLPNRDYFERYIQQVFETRFEQPFALLYLDNDNFKAINDDYGHHTGDILLYTMADYIKTVLNPDDFIARLGGDEFAIIIHHTSTPEQLMPILHTLMNCQTQPLTINHLTLNFSFSIGVAFSSQAQSYKQLIQYADKTMYIAKQQSRIKYAFYHPDALSY